MKGVEQFLVPVQRVEADKLRAVGVGDVGQVTAGQTSDQPGIHGSGGDPAGLGGLPRARYACDGQQTGRGSWRERVVSNVSVSGVSVVCKKNNTIKYKVKK